MLMLMCIILLGGQGVFYFPKLADLTGKDCVVNYNKDRVVFYPSKKTDKLIAVVCSPYERSLTITAHLARTHF